MRFKIIILVVALGISFLFFKNFQPSSTFDTPATPLENQTALEPAHPAAPKKEIISPPPLLNNVIPPSPSTLHRVDPRYTKKPTDLTVEFEVINGLAITGGDTILGKPTTGFVGKTGIAEMRPYKIWNGGVVPYSIAPDVPDPSRIKQAIDYFNEHTVVRFVPYEGQADAIVFQKGEQHCYSYLGKMGGIQPIFLSDRCAPTQIMHELMHALGFIHEQSRIDRDQSLEVLWDNIEEQYYPQFAMMAEPMMENYFDSPFDPHSIMMYEPHTFSIKPGLETLKLKSPGTIEPSTTLSPTDIERVNRLYRN